MEDNYDKHKIVDIMFDPIISQIIAELENEGKDLSYLAQIQSISESEVLERLSYLINHGFVFKKIEDGKARLYADGKKLSSVIENSESFDGPIDGLTKIDSYLN